MNRHFRDRRKIDPTRGATLGDGSPNDADRVEIGPTALAFAEWAAAGLALPDLAGMRRFRWARLTDHVAARGLGGLLMYDPLNIRYATDTTNMQLWNAHNPFRAALLCPDGYLVVWDYPTAPFLCAHNALVREVRKGADHFYFDRGDKVADAARAFAGEVRDLVAEHGGGVMRLAADKPPVHTGWALEAVGFDLVEGEEVTEKARAVKGADEIAAMRCAVHACEAAVAAMEAACAPGLTENDVWAVLHAENIRRGGEWIETRLLASGPRTNPWFQECGPRVVQPGEIVSFDTDLIGCYGICVDISRSWWVGPGRPRADMVEAMQVGVEHIRRNTELLAPGITIPEIVARAHRLPGKYRARRYSCMMHGVGLCDEWPLVAYPETEVGGAFDYALEPGMVLCVEALIGEEGGDFCIKLEDQVLITEDGHEVLSRYPYDAALMGTA
ncbi:MAG: M24 family metallopeptidase [Paracoccaceae bacterium]|nr:M24 family metallopeptidase [Paracoccaceae bacterium]